MNKIVDKIFLGRRQIPSWIATIPSRYSACGPFTKHCKRIQIFRETDNFKHIYKKELDKSCFSHDAAYSDGKDLAKKNYFRQYFER